MKRERKRGMLGDNMLMECSSNAGRRKGQGVVGEGKEGNDKQGRCCEGDYAVKSEE